MSAPDVQGGDPLVTQPANPNPPIATIKERCRSCYTCVRECPVKAIRVSNGKAEVMFWRCIGCGNCVRVCSQKAKQVASSIETVGQLLSSHNAVAACLDPSFPAEFPQTGYRDLVGMLRAMGFAYVHEVAFGADLVAAEYRRLLAQNPHKRFITSTCPAIVGSVQKYHPGLVASLAPICSPMVATARALRLLHGLETKIVFIGPCIAKKLEASAPELSGEVSAVLTFTELQKMIGTAGMTPESVAPAEFDPPLAGQGALFPLARGILQAARIPEDLLQGNAVTADGCSSFMGAIKEFETGDLDAQLIELLCCNGCIMGPGMTSRASHFRRRSIVTQHVRNRLSQEPQTGQTSPGIDLADLDLSRYYLSYKTAEVELREADLEEAMACMGRHSFSPADLQVVGPSDEEIRRVLEHIGMRRPEDELNCGACGYKTCREHAIATYQGLAESEMCLPYTIEQLRRTLRDLATSHDQLRSAQEALMQSEKLVSMGQLASGIAHEVNNPLGVVLMYAHLLLDENKDNPKLREDLQMIAEHTNRCKTIVSGLVNFARQNKISLQETDVTAMVDREMKTLLPPVGVTVRVEHAQPGLVAELDRGQVLQVLTNLVTNAYQAMPDGGTLTVRTHGDEARMRLQVEDTGLGISAEHMSKLFQPFFTTKPLGAGVGLGLAVTYGIVKMHQGDISVASNADPAMGPTGTTFTVSLPRWTRKR